MPAGTKEDPFIGDYKIDDVQHMGTLQLGQNTFNKFLLKLTNSAGQQKQDVEMLRKPQSPAPSVGVSKLQVFQQNSYWKAKFAPAAQGGPPAQGGGAGPGYSGGAASGGSDEERNRSIVMQVSVKAAAEIMASSQPAADAVIGYARYLADQILAYAKEGVAPAQPPAAPQPQAQAQPQAQPPAQGGNDGWSGGGTPAQASFPATGDDDIPF